MPSFDPAVSRRTCLRVLAGGTLFAAGGPSAFAGEGVIGRLIGESRAYAAISQRLDFISRALLGAKYQAHTLIGGPRRPEKFVVRDDAFDCVTYCEIVLAVAIAHDLGEFETSLRNIRYRDGSVSWERRNHYFYEWCQYNIENNICRPVALGDIVKVDKTVNSPPALGKRRLSLAGIPRAALLANQHLLVNGDIVGFMSNRSYLDYFHTGFVVFGGNHELLLRHASKSRHRVLEERMERFLAVNRVRYVTLLRPQEPAA